MIMAIDDVAATRTGKVVVALWLVALLVFIGCLVGGLLQGEFLGYVAFAILPTAILLNISIVLAQYVKKGSVKIAKAGWITMAIVALLLAIYGFDGKSDSDIFVVLTWSMLVLSFPVSLLVSLARMVLPAAIDTSYLSLAIEWAVYVTLGYWQWFVVVPKVWARTSSGARRPPTD